MGPAPQPPRKAANAGRMCRMWRRRCCGGRADVGGHLPGWRRAPKFNFLVPRPPLQLSWPPPPPGYRATALLQAVSAAPPHRSPQADARTSAARWAGGRGLTSPMHARTRSSAAPSLAHPVPHHCLGCRRLGLLSSVRARALLNSNSCPYPYHNKGLCSGRNQAACAGHIGCRGSSCVNCVYSATSHICSSRQTPWFVAGRLQEGSGTCPDAVNFQGIFQFRFPCPRCSPPPPPPAAPPPPPSPPPPSPLPPSPPPPSPPRFTVLLAPVHGQPLRNACCCQGSNAALPA